MSHHESHGCAWEEGEVPTCTVCGENVAVWETAHCGVYLCDDDNCLLEYVRNESHEIELVEDDEDEDDGKIVLPSYTHFGGTGSGAEIILEEGASLDLGTQGGSENVTVICVEEEE